MAGRCLARAPGSRHIDIIKPGIQRLHHQAALEHATMRVAARLGLRVAQTRLDDFKGEPAIVVTRFDRVATIDGTIHRLHQVDFCQAMGRYPKNKYEEKSGPSTKDLADMLRQESSLSEQDVRGFSDAVLFNYIVGAPDGHSKNFALLYGPDGRARKFGEVLGKNIDRHAEEMRLDPAERRDRAAEIADAVPRIFGEELADLGAPDASWPNASCHA